MSASTVGILLRSIQAYCGQLCEKQTLDHGIAYYCRRFPQVAEVNQFREVVAQASELANAYRQAEEFFTQADLTCLRWAPAVGEPREAHEAHLLDQGFRRVEYQAMSLGRWVELPVGDVRILPARAMRSALRATFTETNDDADRVSPSTKAELFEERLDDPRMDAFVAMMGDQLAGRCALFQVGDSAQLVEHHVTADHAGGAVGAALLGHVLRLAQRLNMQTICTAVEARDEQAIELYTSAGFTSDDTFVEFVRPSPNAARRDRRGD